MKLHNILKKLKTVITILLILGGIFSLLFTFFGLNDYKILALITLVVIYGCLILVAKKNLKVGCILIALLQIGIFVWFNNISAKDKFANITFQDPWLKKPTLNFNGDLITINNIRDFKYKTENDFQINYIKETFNVNNLETLNFALSYWDGNKNIAHSMVIFNFKDGKKLVFSVESRLPVGVEQQLMSGLFKQYEQIIVIGTYRDVIDLRVHYRANELVYVYEVFASKKQIIQFFVDLCKRTEKLNEEPEFYNTLCRNCTTSLLPSIKSVNPSFMGNIRLLLNGHSDKLFFELGSLKHLPNESFESLKKRSLIKK